MELEKLCSEVLVIAKEAGAFIKKEFHAFDKSKIEYKETNNLVSYVDKGAEKIIVNALQKLLPEAGFIAEEGTATHQGEDLVWIIDPLDGTTNFSHGLPIWSVSIALRKGDDALIGVVYEPNLDEMFYAWKNGGAYCNGKLIQVSQESSLSKSLIATGFPYYQFENTDTYLKILGDLMQKTHGLRRWGSAAVDLAYTACGRYEGFFEYNLNSYDVAAGLLFVTEAGGQVADFGTGQKHLSGEEVVASGKVLSELKEVIREYWTQNK